MNHEKLSDELEDIIVGKLLRALNDNDYRAEIETDGYIGVFDSMTDNKVGFIKLVAGNGSEIISDYSTNLEEVLKPVQEFCEQYY